MYVPASYALVLDDHADARAFFYAGTLGLIMVALISIAMGGRRGRYGATSDTEGIQCSSNVAAECESDTLYVSAFWRGRGHDGIACSGEYAGYAKSIAGD